MTPDPPPQAGGRRGRARPRQGASNPRSWDDAAAAVGALQQPPIVAYCRWRQAEALVAPGAPAADAHPPGRLTVAAADRRATAQGGDPAASPTRTAGISHRQARNPDQGSGLAECWGLTPARGRGPRLVARGYTNRQIDRPALVISAKDRQRPRLPIMGKLDARNGSKPPPSPIASPRQHRPRRGELLVDMLRSTKASRRGPSRKLASLRRCGCYPASAMATWTLLTISETAAQIRPASAGSDSTRRCAGGGVVAEFRRASPADQPGW